MKQKILKILEIVFWVVLAGGLVTLAGFTLYIHGDEVCKSYSIHIDYGKADVLITGEDVYNVVKKTGNLLKGQAIKSINFAGIEEAVMHQPYVASAQVYATMEGDVVIRVLQRQPVLRVFSQHGESYYLDASGTMLPLNPGYPARVPVASGFIDEPLVRNKNYSVDSVRAGDSLRYHAVMNNLFRLASYIACSPFLKAQVEQVYVDRDGEMELIPRVGNHIILMGRADDLDDKFTRLMVFYRLGLNSTGWDKYQIINIKYKHQVVCSKI